MSTELKTLRQIADEVGKFPFEVIGSETNGTVKLFGINLEGTGMVGQRSIARNPDTWKMDEPLWTLVTPKKKLVEFLYQGTGVCNYHSRWEESPQEWCEGRGFAFVKILREVEL